MPFLPTALRPVLRSATLLAILVLAIGLNGCVTPVMRNADTLSPAGVLSGSVMDEARCEALRTAWDGGDTVWVVLDPDWDPDDGTCIRYMHAGLAQTNPVVHVYLHGDVMQQSESGWAQVWPGYETVTVDRLRGFATRENETTGVPYIRLSRPGTYGSSGFHKQRRRAREALIVDAALDLIRERHRIGEFAAVGQSGGGHVVARLLTLRDDLRCAVIASGVVSVRQRAGLHGWTTDITGYRDSVDPVEEVDAIVADPDRRIFVLGDPRDSNTPFVTQTAYYEAVKRAGHDVTLLTATGGGKAHHSLALTGFRVMRWCLDGLSGAAMQSRLAAPENE